MNIMTLECHRDGVIDQRKRRKFIQLKIKEKKESRKLARETRLKFHLSSPKFLFCLVAKLIETNLQ